LAIPQNAIFPIMIGFVEFHRLGSEKITKAGLSLVLWHLHGQKKFIMHPFQITIEKKVNKTMG
jgi:hypothetical protein